MEDAQIVTLYWQRNEDAIRATQEKYDRYLNKVANQILADLEDSRESVNDTYLAAWNSMPPHRPTVLSGYLSKITRRISIDCFRSKNRDKRRPSQYALSLEELGEVCGGNTPEETVDAKLLAGSIAAFLRAQSSDARNLFIGRYYYFDSLKEAAAYCGMTESKAKSLLYRTRLALREHLNKEGFSV